MKTGRAKLTSRTRRTAGSRSALWGGAPVGKSVDLAALKPYKGTVRHISFPPHVEGELHRILKKRTVYARYPFRATD